ncbi:AMP-dependent synthetase/ligase domain-containing protein [Strongyloides ratti]|uniref:long-chain-fatty-acid--CoA ligase n=1 Tax=Strongyloides ratti TaxID=34506 RepID=A0A090LIU0_STRRB|nr:AMP-dependent synthetase/ligase domain-containing protein [Strongyloides ratti]CEF67425.1 AMP-dependent synthetase/ligase domain-containing protein [Strongyloides ratti]
MTVQKPDVKRIDKILSQQERPFYLNIVSGIFKLFFLIYDIISYVPFKIFNDPKAKLRLSVRRKGVKLDPNDPFSPFRHVESVNKLRSILVEGCHTLDQMFSNSVKIYGSLPCMGTREILTKEQVKQEDGRYFQKCELGTYKWLNYTTVGNCVTNISCALNSLGLKKGTLVVIFAETRAEWMITAQACFRNGLPIVTVYSTLGEDAVAYAIKESEGVCLFTSSNLLEMIDKISDKISNIKHVIYFEDRFNPSSEDNKCQIAIENLNSKMKTCMLFDNFMTTGEGLETSIQNISKPDDLCMIMYTSGSTGNPKGVMLSHKNIIASLTGANYVINVTCNDCYIAYLPLSHVLELAVETCLLSVGCRIGYSSPTTLFDRAPKIKPGTKGDISVLRPSLMAAVPAIMDRIFKAVTEEVSTKPALFREFFRLCYERRRARYLDGYASAFMNKLVFGKIKKILGGKLRVILSGGAPLAPETQRFMNICFCCPVVQGYGLTETCGGGTIGDIHDLSTGYVGPPLICSEIYLHPWEEAGYSPVNHPPTGEILIHGDNVSLGYFKNPEKTNEDFIEINGKRYFCTGDIGEVRSDGAFKIIDRKKDLIKLQHGEYISLGKIESIIVTNKYVDNVCVFANSFNDYCVALIVPNEKNLTLLAEQLEVKTGDWKEICKNKIVVSGLLKELNNFLKGKLSRVEIPKKLFICDEVWTPASGLLTEALKLKRKVIEGHYKSTLTALYK